MRYVIMCDGKMTRWKKDHDVPKHLVDIGGETLLARIVRQLRENDDNCKIIITSHDERYEIEGADRYEPVNNRLEIDRFTWELIEPQVCFLYGDTFYSDFAVRSIVNMNSEQISFAGTKDSIVAVKISDAETAKKHIEDIRCKFERGEIAECKGWQLYSSYMGLPLEGRKIAGNYVLIDDETQGFNTVAEYKAFVSHIKKKT